MTIHYFPDTGTLLITFNDAPVVETREVTEDLLVDLDDASHVVSVTVEHARHQANLDAVSLHLTGAVPQPAGGA